MKEFLDLLGEYVRGAQPFSALGGWLAGVNWDDPDMTEEEQEVFGLFELLTTDVSEGLREEEELISEAVGAIVRFIIKQDRRIPLQDTGAMVTMEATSGATYIEVAPTAADSSNQQSWNKSPELAFS